MDPGDRIGLLVSGRQDVIQIQCRGISRSGTGISDNQLADIFDTRCMCNLGDGHTMKGLQGEELESQLIQCILTVTVPQRLMKDEQRLQYTGQ